MNLRPDPPALTPVESRALLAALGAPFECQNGEEIFAMLAVQKDVNCAAAAWGPKLLAMLAGVAEKNETPVEALERLLAK